MKDVLAALGLKEGTTEEEAVAAIETLKARATRLARHGFKPEEVAAKVALGLTEAQAVAVLTAQAEEDEAAAKKEKAAKK